MYNFPTWSDLGNSIKASQDTLYKWSSEVNRIERYRYYYDGDVFDEKIQTERGQIDDDVPLLYPVGMNLVKMLCLSQTDAAFGEYEHLPIQWSVRQDDEFNPSDTTAIEIMTQILINSNAETLFWELELDRNIFGGAVFKIEPTEPLGTPGHIRWKKIPKQNFFPIWNPTDPDDLIEAYVVTAMTADQAKIMYNMEFNQAVVYRVERWNKRMSENWIGDRKIDKYSIPNPYGIVPFVYIPRVRLSNWYGDALTKDVIDVQNDLNMRVADMSDAINYNAHPTRWGMNLSREFDQRNFPVGSNSMWNLGRSVNANFEPKVGILEAEHAIKPEVFEFIKFEYDWARTSVFAPPIAFGEDQGGGQRSGVTLEIRMWPLIKSIRRSRNYFTTGLSRAMKITAAILKQKQFKDIPVKAIKAIEDGRVIPVYYPILPQEQPKLVDEIVKLRSLDPPGISLETSQKVLGRGIGEVERIKDELDDEKLNPEPEPVWGTAPGDVAQKQDQPEGTGEKAKSEL